MNKTLEDFQKKHDPTYVILNPTAVYSRELPKEARRAIVVAAQNATPVHKAWWDVLRNIAEKTGAEILVIPLRYKNPTSQWSGSQQNAEHWAPEVRDLLWNTRHPLNSNLTLLGDIKVQPTASNPLSGAEALSLASSGIIGHTKLQLKTVPTPQSRFAKLLTTTGACTVANYTDSRAGRIAQFHHSLSAIMVELDGEQFHLRQLHFDQRSQSCTDLDKRYYADGRAIKAPQPLALAMGDTHVDFICPQVEAATFGDGGIVEALRPKHLIWHDLLDGYSVNPHHLGNPFNTVAKAKGNRSDVRSEVNRAIEFVREKTPRYAQSIVVASNHDDFLRRWVLRADWKQDPLNAAFYLETALAMTRSARIGSGGTEYDDPFAYWFKSAKIPRSRTLALDESFILGGIELGMHGDIGPNGARGSIQNLRRIGVKSVIGHSHRPGIDEGCYQVGTSTRLRLEYNHGASGWMNTHCVLHADGKRQLINIIDGKWRI